MRGLAVSLTALIVVGLAWAAVGDKPPYPVFTPPNFVSTMKLLGPNFAAVNAAIGRNDFENAKAHLVRSRELLAISITFWRDRKKDDAIKILRDTLTKMDDLDSALSSDSIDSAAATAIAKQIGAGCQSCHTLYREQDPETKRYRFKKSLGE
jgi:hypothetical protein